MSSPRAILHVDVNSAFLSWSNLGYMAEGGQDLRLIPSAVAGDQHARHGIILAKSIPAKNLGITTGEPLFQARKKCPQLITVPPNHLLYIKLSKALGEIVAQYSPVIEQFSIDEYFIDYTGSEKALGPAEEAADRLREQVKNQLGFTVNVGIGPNKVLAKMAGEFSKPDRTHHLYTEEIEQRLWPLPIRDLFMLGAASERTLRSRGIFTIGDLACVSPEFAYRLLKSHGTTLWGYANGIDPSPVTPNKETEPKSFSNSVSTPFDLTDREDILAVLSQLCDSVCVRMRCEGYVCRLVSVGLRDSDFQTASRQSKLTRPSSLTAELYEAAKLLISQLWNGRPIRQISIGLGELLPAAEAPLSLFDNEQRLRLTLLDQTFDTIRKRFGSDAIRHGVQLGNFEIDHLARYAPNAEKPPSKCPF